MKKLKNLHGCIYMQTSAWSYLRPVQIWKYVFEVMHQVGLHHIHETKLKQVNHGSIAICNNLDMVSLAYTINYDLLIHVLNIIRLYKSLFKSGEIWHYCHLINIQHKWQMKDYHAIKPILDQSTAMKSEMNSILFDFGSNKYLVDPGLCWSQVRRISVIWDSKLKSNCARNGKQDNRHT